MSAKAFGSLVTSSTRTAEDPSHHCPECNVYSDLPENNIKVTESSTTQLSTDGNVENNQDPGPDGRDRVALVTGITGQDGSYLTEFLLDKGYKVHGVIRRSSSFNTGRIDHLRANPNLTLHYGDLTDAGCLMGIVSRVRPSEVYNLGAQSHVKVSFDMAEYTGNVDALGTLRLLEAIRACGLTEHVAFYQASTSELYGKVLETPQNEETPFYPRSPYGVAKLYSYWIVINYREAYGMHASNGILFNHESPRRGRTFVTRKISRAVAEISTGKLTQVMLGNLDSRRDWGHTKDYVEGMWLMTQTKSPSDYVLATGECHTVREFVETAFAVVGLNISWKNPTKEAKSTPLGNTTMESVKSFDKISISNDIKQGNSQTDNHTETTDFDPKDEIGIDQNGVVRVRVDPVYYRPTEVDILLGDPSKARVALGWVPKVKFLELVQEMVLADVAAIKTKNEPY